MNLYKSRYTAYCQCPKNLWYRVYHPEFAAVVDPAAQVCFDTGSAVGEMDTWAMVKCGSDCVFFYTNCYELSIINGQLDGYYV